MTYDLHGQWDYDNKWSSPGCRDGNSLRSHINLTETTNALAMITKAGVQANKIFVGITSYGRSFRMAEKGCVGEMCRFAGSRNTSEAQKGYCTKTAGYIANAEIREILWQAKDSENTGYTTVTYHDGASNSDMLVYNDMEWVAYMTDTTKGTRTDYYKGLNFGGVSDWAVDLDTHWAPYGIGGSGKGGDYVNEIKCPPTPGGGTGGCIDFAITIQGYPKLKPDFQMPNPKDIMTQALPNLGRLEDQLTAALFDIGLAFGRAATRTCSRCSRCPSS